ncbi:hypothetical protein MBLNU457_6070t1 [Dothideomycetes sp. NU457]
MLTKLFIAVALVATAFAPATAGAKISERAVTASVPCTDTTTSKSLNLTTRTSTTTLPPSTLFVTLIQINTTASSNLSTAAPATGSLSTSAPCISNSTTSSAFVAPVSVPANISTSIVIPASIPCNTIAVIVTPLPPLPTLNITYAFNTTPASTSIAKASASVTVTNYPGYNVFNLTNTAPRFGVGKDHKLDMGGILRLIVTILLLSQVI